MKKVTMDDFKENKGLIAVTMILSFMTGISYLIEPEYYSRVTASILLIVMWPLVAWWFMAFWNRILYKMFTLKQISYGVAFVLIGATTLIF